MTNHFQPNSDLDTEESIFEDEDYLPVIGMEHKTIRAFIKEKKLKNTDKYIIALMVFQYWDFNNQDKVFDLLEKIK